MELLNAWGLCILSGSVGSGIMAIILAAMNRKWAKEDKKDEKMEVIIDCLSVLMVDRVRHVGMGYISKNKLTLDEKEEIEEMYSVYDSLRKEKQESKDKLVTIMQEVRRLQVINK